MLCMYDAHLAVINNPLYEIMEISVKTQVLCDSYNGVIQKNV